MTVKIRLIVVLITDYLIALFDRNSRDYREVSKQLAQMKLDAKQTQSERTRSETNTQTVRRRVAATVACRTR
jgi:uncharacterized membrane protein